MGGSSVSDGAPHPAEFDEPPRPAGRVPPHNLEAEESLLGAMLLSSDAIAAAIEIVTVDDFYKPAHGHIFDAITSLYAQGEPADPVTVAEELQRAGLLESVGGAGGAGRPPVLDAGHVQRLLLRQDHRGARAAAAAHRGRRRDRRARLRHPRRRGQGRRPAESMVFEVAERRITDTMMPIHQLMDPASTGSSSSTRQGRASPACPPATATSTRCSRLPAQLAGGHRRPPRHRQDQLGLGHGRRRRHAGQEVRCCSSRWR